MGYQINSDCISCAACVDSCPVGAIVEGSEKYEINEECVECGACVDTCPVSAIVNV